MQKLLLLYAFAALSHVRRAQTAPAASKTAAEEASDRIERECRDFPEIVLTEILGAAFNKRYMSIGRPLQRDQYMSEHQVDLKRGTASPIPSFYVEDDYARILSEEPAWIVRHSHIGHDVTSASSTIGTSSTMGASSLRDRNKRSDKYRMQWECESKIKWIDLGPDYFPRYLRTVECTTKHCWYGHYKCKPRSFTVKILKRRRDKCINVDTGSLLIDADDDADNGNGIKFDRDVTDSRRSNNGNDDGKRWKIGTSGMPKELKTLWVWEERAVNFCCDCSL